jgi:hypothetical protein
LTEARKETEMDNKDRIDKQRTSDAERSREDEFGLAGNVREKGQDPSPGDRARGERSDKDPVEPEAASRR